MQTSVLLLTVAFAAPLLGQPVRLPVYGARKTVDRITIDGKLDEFTWAASPHLIDFRLIHAPERRPKFPTEGAVVWDDDNLYVNFASRDREPWSRMTKRDDRLWEEEVVEVFLDPDGDGQNYAELEVSPNNVVVDLLITKPRAGLGDALKWDIEGLRTAVTRHPAGWIAEISIPWKSLAAAGAKTAPANGERWRAGLYRIKRPGGPSKADQIAALLTQVKSDPARKAEIEAKLTELRASDEYSAWSVTRPERGYHDPERFGYLEFLDLP